MHEKRVFEDFQINNLGENHDLYLESDTLLLANVFQNFREMCLKTYQLNPAIFFSAPGFAWQIALKKTTVKLELLTDIDMILIVGQGIRGGIYNAIYRYAKANNKYMKDHDKNKELSFLNYWDVNNLYGWAIWQKLSVNNFEWIEDGFIKVYNEESAEGYFLEVDIQYPEKIDKLYSDLPFLPERKKLKKVEKLLTNFHDKTEYVIHIRNLKQALNHRLILKKVHRVVKFNQKNG